MLIAAYFGEEEIQWGSNQEKTIGLIVSIMLIQIVAILGAFLTAHASKRFGNILTLIVINLIWAGICISGAAGGHFRNLRKKCCTTVGSRASGVPWEPVS